MLNRLRLWLRARFLSRRLDREMRDEMADHLARIVERMMAQGMARDEAERAARREFGNLNVLREEARDARGGRRLESLAADVRFGLRQFARRPVSTITMIVVLALGIGFNSALFVLVSSFVRGVPAGFTPDESLVRIRGIDRNQSRGFALGREFSSSEYAKYAAQTDLFGAVAAWTSSDVALDVGRDEESLQSGAATYVTASYFQVLGVLPIAGAGLPGHDAPELVTVISYTVWDRFYGQANDVIGRTLKVNGVPVTIVGVAPRRFNGARTGGSHVRVWLPLSARPLVQRTPAHAGQSPDTAIFGIVARLQPGIQARHTLSVVEAIAARTDAQQTTRRAGILSTDVVPLLADIGGLRRRRRALPAPSPRWSRPATRSGRPSSRRGPIAARSAGRRSRPSTWTPPGGPSWSSAGAREPGRSTSPSRARSPISAGGPTSRSSVSAGVAHAEALHRAVDRRAALLVRVLPFIERMDLALAIADVAVSRAGGSVAELAICGVPADPGAVPARHRGPPDGERAGAGGGRRGPPDRGRRPHGGRHGGWHPGARG